jgi:RNA polymerase primary sigma factor
MVTKKQSLALRRHPNRGSSIAEATKVSTSISKFKRFKDIVKETKGDSSNSVRKGKKTHTRKIVEDVRTNALDDVKEVKKVREVRGVVKYKSLPRLIIPNKTSSKEDILGKEDSNQETKQPKRTGGDFIDNEGEHYRELSGFSAYIQSLPSYDLLSDKDEKRLVRIAQGNSIAAKKAIETLILSNMRLVISMAKKYTKYGCPMEDLVSEGSIGLGVAIEKYKAHKGARLSTYAVWWIKQYLRKATNDSARTIKIPIYQQKTLRAINATISKLKETTGLDPSDDEVAGELGLTTKHVQTLRHATVPLISLQNPINNQDNSRTYEEVLCDQSGSTDSPLEHLSKKTAAEGLLALIKKRLSKKEQEVVILRFGLDGKGSDNRTLEEVGNLLELTRERIRQIQEGALKKLKGSLEAEAANKPTLLTVL